MGDVIYITVFVVLFVVIHKVLKEHPIFEKGNVIISLCVSLLCIIGMRRMFVQGDGEGLDGMLLPYAVLGISILFMLLLMLIKKLPRPEKPKRRKRAESELDTRERRRSERIREV